VNSLEDEVGHLGRVRDHRDVRRLDLDRGGPGALCHEPFSRGGMAWSSPATRYHDGIVFQAGGPEGSPRTAASSGRCSAAINADLADGTSAQKTSWKALGVM
jgi:hypothetical protein